ncbi:MAG: acetylornithine transaminase [Lentisphaerae bacterium]|jgi:acetylornithine/N-succinyldiaminopimelate aminotransferase|nr:acetylornithine transaminase [Lentisphaerota bacterium]
MSKNEDIAALFNQYVMHTYSPSVTLVRGQGCKVWDADGMVYLDFTAGIAVQNVGHAHPRVVQAVSDQMTTLNHCSNLYYTANQALLAQRLVHLSTLEGKCFFCNSGAEANEALIKLARLWGHEEGRYEIIAMRNSFHGRTLATAAATGQSKIQQGFDPMPVGFTFAEFNDLESVRKLVNERTVAVMLEPVQGEGGLLPATTEFMQGLRALCDEKNLLLLCDEVQSGMGRTGHWFAWQQYGVRPDAFSLAKALASGVPMGAIVASAKLADVFQPGRHASTFGGNPLACAAALATIDVIESEKLVERAQEAGQQLRESLMAFVEKYDQLLDVRGAGLMVGLVLDKPAKDLVTKCREMGLLCCMAGEKVVRFLPPLNVRDDELEEALDILDDALDMLYGEEAEEAEAEETPEAEA